MSYDEIQRGLIMTQRGPYKPANDAKLPRGVPTEQETREYEQDMIAERDGYGSPQSRYRIRRYKLLYKDGDQE